MTMPDVFDDLLMDIPIAKVKKIKPDLRVFTKNCQQECREFTDGRKQRSCKFYWRNPLSKKCFFLGGDVRKPNNQCICYDTQEGDL